MRCLVVQMDLLDHRETSTRHYRYALVKVSLRLCDFSADPDGSEQDFTESDDEGTKDYKKGGYHPVNVG